MKENPKIEVKDGDLFVFKPKYNITSKKKLLKLLDKNDREGLGGILLEDVEEALPNCTKALKVNVENTETLLYYLMSTEQICQSCTKNKIVK